jgi:hypothetical protein
MADQIERKKNCVEQGVEYTLKSALELVEKWNQVRSQLTPMIEELIKVEIEPAFASYSLDISFTGDKDKLVAALRIIMREGYKGKEEKPKQGDTSWYSWFHAEGKHPIWFSFTSSVCRRVKVGTKMVEQDVYEVRCGDDSVVSEDQLEIMSETAGMLPAKQAQDDGIPF